MSFPERPYTDIASYFCSYRDEIARAAQTVAPAALDAAQRLLNQVLDRDGQVFSCGNGGSAGISNHLVCDHVKGVCTDTGLRPRVHSLSANVEMMTAIANDIDYAEVFSWQLSMLSRPGDLLITISSSGNSENIVRAVQWAKANGVSTISMTGFDGGRSASIADVNIHVQADNYGVVEDIHQSIMHVLAQFVRQSRMPAELVAARRF